MRPAVSDQLSPAQLRRICGLVRRESGIHLPEDKQALVRARLRRRLAELGLPDFGAYLRHLSADRTGRELDLLLDALATHLTGFMREPEHFEFLRSELLPETCARGGPLRLRLWSAGCATGEEAYSLALTVRDAQSRPESWDVRILATDLSRRALAAARRGVYPAERVAALPERMRARHFTSLEGEQGPACRVSEELRRSVWFARLNLIGPWPLRGPFDAIFCRNVMIYFDPATQRSLVARFRDLLRADGVLCLGHAESLTGDHAGWRFERPSIYRRA